MSYPITLEALEELTSQLKPSDQLKLAARICETLSQENNSSVVEAEDLDAYLNACNDVAALWEGPFDSAQDIRSIRDEE